MVHERWHDRLQETQAGYVPLITTCLLAVVVLSAIRDPIVIDLVPVSLIVLNGLAITSLLGMTAWSRWRPVPSTASNRFVLFALLVFSTKAVAIVYIESEPYPFIMAILMFALSLCFLSQTYLLGTALAVTLAWSAVALVSVTTMQLVSTLVAMIVGCVFGLLVLERRISTLTRVFELERRVADLETILPMCASCKKTRDEQGRWMTIENYLEENTGEKVSHGVCPQCTQELYGDFLQKKAVAGDKG